MSNWLAMDDPDDLQRSTLRVHPLHAGLSTQQEPWRSADASMGRVA